MIALSSDGFIIARDNNSKHPSQTLKTPDISVNGLIELLNKGISKPHPSLEMIKQFISRYEEKMNEKQKKQ